VISIRFAYVLLALPVLLLLNACSNYHGVMSRPNIDDGIRYGRVEFPASRMEPYHFAGREENAELPALERWADRKAIRNYDSPEQLFTGSHTTAFLVIRNDTIIYEGYFNGRGPDDITQVFSITKPLTVSLLSQALEEGLIDSVDEPVNGYLGIRKRKKKCNDLTLRHLANMQSGFNHSDHLRILRIIRFYHAVNADNYIRKVKVFRDPGKKYRYKSIDTQVLGACLENIFGEDDLMDRFVDLYWNNIGPEHRGYYSVDHKDSGNLKYYGGLNISARDLAKIGRIYLNDGKFSGKRVLTGEWMDYIRDSANHVGKWDYSMGWYFDESGENRDIYYGSGFNGQLLVMNKTTNTIIVRLGETKDGHEWYHILSEMSTLF
jgi:CubicO group peptidase (beta-lactamase class C family)